MWILFNIEDDGFMRKAKVLDYLEQMSYPVLELPRELLDEVFELFDEDQDGYLEKVEMEYYLTSIMIMQANLSFKSSESYLSKLSD